MDDGLGFTLGKLPVQSMLQWHLLDDLLYILDEALNVNMIRIYGMDLLNHNPHFVDSMIMSL